MGHTKVIKYLLVMSCQIKKQSVVFSKFKPFPIDFMDPELTLSFYLRVFYFVLFNGN